MLLVKRIIRITCAKNSKIRLNLLTLFMEDCRFFFGHGVYTQMLYSSLGLFIII